MTDVNIHATQWAVSRGVYTRNVELAPMLGAYVVIGPRKAQTIAALLRELDAMPDRADLGCAQVSRRGVRVARHSLASRPFWVMNVTRKVSIFATYDVATIAAVADSLESALNQ